MLAYSSFVINEMTFVDTLMLLMQPDATACRDASQMACQPGAGARGSDHSSARPAQRGPGRTARSGCETIQHQHQRTDTNERNTCHVPHGLVEKRAEYVERTAAAPSDMQVSWCPARDAAGSSVRREGARHGGVHMESERKGGEYAVPSC